MNLILLTEDDFEAGGGVLSFVAKYFERIGDQATNVCEQIVYMIDAQVIKHAGVSPDGSNEPSE